MRTMVIFVVMLGLLWWPLGIFAQDSLPEPQLASSPGPPPPGLPLPIDNGIIFLIISGLTLGCVVYYKPPKKAY